MSIRPSAPPRCVQVPALTRGSGDPNCLPRFVNVLPGDYPWTSRCSLGQARPVTKRWKHRTSAGKWAALSPSADMLAALRGLNDLRDRRALTYTELQEATTQLLDRTRLDPASEVDFNSTPPPRASRTT